jgi:hypothetical protein
MVNEIGAHKCWTVRVRVKPNIDEIYNVIAGNAVKAAENAAAAFRVVHMTKITADMIEIKESAYFIWIDEQTIG